MFTQIGAIVAVLMALQSCAQPKQDSQTDREAPSIPQSQLSASPTYDDDTSAEPKTMATSDRIAEVPSPYTLPSVEEETTVPDGPSSKQETQEQDDALSQGGGGGIVYARDGLSGFRQGVLVNPVAFLDQLFTTPMAQAQMRQADRLFKGQYIVKAGIPSQAAFGLGFIEFQDGSSPEAASNPRRGLCPTMFAINRGRIEPINRDTQLLLSDKGMCILPAIGTEVTDNSQAWMSLGLLPKVYRNVLESSTMRRQAEMAASSFEGNYELSINIPTPSSGLPISIEIIDTSSAEAIYAERRLCPVFFVADWSTGAVELDNTTHTQDQDNKQSACIAP